MLHGWENLTPEEKERIAQGVADGKVDGGPYHIELSPTDNCNYDCFFCNQGFIDRKKKLPLERLKKLIDELSGMGLKTIRLSGGGEPLIYPRIGEFLDHLQRRNISLDNVTTNGFMLTARMTERLMALSTKEINVSLNESDPERYGEMMKVRPKDFHRVVKNLKELIATRQKLGRNDPKLITQFFVWKGNFQDVGRMVDLAHDIGADTIFLRDIYGLKPEQRLNQEEREQLLRLVAPLAADEPEERFGIDFGFEQVFLLGRQGRQRGEKKPPCQAGRDRYCYIGWYSAAIRGDGTVYPCCILQQDPGYPPLGNVLEQSFQEIWHGEAYVLLRKELRSIALQRGEVRDPGGLVQTRPFCAAEDECPLLYALCDDDFYRDMNQRLERYRRGLRQILARKMRKTV